MADADEYEEEEDMDELIRREEEEQKHDQPPPTRGRPALSSPLSASTRPSSSHADIGLPSLERVTAAAVGDDGLGGGFVVDDGGDAPSAELEHKYDDDRPSASPLSTGSVKRKRADSVEADDFDDDAIAELDAHIAEHEHSKLSSSPPAARPPGAAGSSADVQRCSECGQLAYNVPYEKAFHVAVCNGCQSQSPAVYSLITKSTARSTYLLTDAELQALPFLLKPNPTRGSFANMKLYRLSDVLPLCEVRWGSAAGVEEEKKRREVERLQKEVEKRKKTRRELDKERRLREYRVDQQKERGHRHTFADDARTGKQKCTGCGFSVDFEEI